MQEQDISLLQLQRGSASLRVASVSRVGGSRSFAYWAGVSEFYTAVLEQEAFAESSQRLAQNAGPARDGVYRVFSSEKPSAVADWLSD
eukprot:1306259-Rhodomonas_salina.1